MPPQLRLYLIPEARQLVLTLGGWLKCVGGPVGLIERLLR